MSKVKPTEVPVMEKDQPFEDWRKEIRIWEKTNTILNVDPIVQAGCLYKALKGLPKTTVTSELTEDEIMSEEGVKKIIDTLSFFYIGNVTQSAFNGIDNLIKYKRPATLSLEEFFIEFQLKVSKVKASGTTLSESILGYALLNAANLSEEKRNMVKITCNELTYKTVKAQIEKVGLGEKIGQHSKFSVDKDVAEPKVKMEQVFHTSSKNYDYHQLESSDSSSDEDNNKIFYMGQNNQMNRFQNIRKPKMNPVDKFGHVRACAFCKCHYHWLADCPYAPSSVKMEVANKSRFKNVQKTL